MEKQPHPLFVTVSGDLSAHGFLCKYQHLAPKATAADFSAFAAKTAAFISLELRRTFPGVPIYLALGNNDSGCGDYGESMHSAYLQAVGQSFAADVLNSRSRKAIAAVFSSTGDYSIALPAPIRKGRLIVLQDLFESARYKPCAADKTPAAAPREQQIRWLRQQLAVALAAHEQVWVMTHIPPGIDIYNTFARRRDVCGGKPPEMFLADDALTAALTDYAETVRLAIFAHSHMDEMRLLTNFGKHVPAKLVPSISPVNGNNPAFIVAEVETATATMKDYAVYAGTNQTGIDTSFPEEYRYSTTYGEPDFSAASVANITAKLVADKAGTTPDSSAYQRFYFVGDPLVSGNVKAAAMRLVWPGFACAVAETTEAGFRTCFCPATPTR